MRAAEQRPHTTALGLAYLLALPAAWVPGADTRWPLVIYLHGAGESGSDPRDLLSEGATGTPPMLAARPSGLGKAFIVASPQTSMGWTSADAAHKVRGLLDELLSRPSLQVDPRRVYLTGVSMGGAGVWAVAASLEGRFAAIAPVCGSMGRGTGRVASALAAMPVWVWHGANDVVVPVGESDRAVAALQQAGAKGVTFTRFDHAPAPVGWPDYTGHAAWIPAYDTGPATSTSGGLWDWLLQHEPPLTGAPR